MNVLVGGRLCAGLLCVAMTGAAALAQNIVANPGFETGTTAGWLGSCGVTAAQAHTGQYSAAPGALSQTFDAIPLHRVAKASFWLKHEALEDSFAYYSTWVETRTGESLVGAVPLRPWSLDWQQYDIALGADPDCVLKGISFGGTGSYLDDVRIVLNARQVKIDIKPGQPDNEVNLRAKGTLPVAILGGSSFDVGGVDAASIRLDGLAPTPRGAKGRIGSLEDVNGDSVLDLVLAFSTADLPFPPNTVLAELSGRLLDGTEFFGTDAIRLVGGPPASAGQAPAGVQAMPEPTCLAGLLAGLATLVRKRRR